MTQAHKSANRECGSGRLGEQAKDAFYLVEAVGIGFLRLGRPRVAVDVSRIAALRSQGHSWGAIRRETGNNQGDGPAGLLQPATNPCIVGSLTLRNRTRRDLP